MDADDSDDLIYGDSNYSNNDSYDHIDIDTKDRHDGDDIPHDSLRSAANYYYESRYGKLWQYEASESGGFWPPRHITMEETRAHTEYERQHIERISNLSEVEREEIRDGECQRMVSWMDNPQKYGATNLLKWGEYYVPDDEMNSSDDDNSVKCEEAMEMTTKECDDEIYNAGYPHYTSLEQTPMNFDQLMNDVSVSNPTLMGMPDIVLEKILHFTAKKPSEICVLERVCKRIHKMTTTCSEFWARHPTSKDRSLVLARNFKGLDEASGKPNAEPRTPLFGIRRRYPRRFAQFEQCKEDIANCPFSREMAFQLEAIGQVRCYQSSSSNAILDVLGDENECVAGTFRTLSADILSRMNQCGGPEVRFRLRGDTIGYLCELLQGYMVRIIENANLMAIHSSSKAVHEGDIALAFRSHKGLFRPFFCGYPTQDPTLQMESRDSCLRLPSSSGIVWRWPLNNCCDVLSPEAGRRIIRRLAYQAGIVQMSNEAFILAEAEMLHALGLLLVSAYESSVNMKGKTTPFLDEEDELTYEAPHSAVDMFSYPPPPFQNEQQLVYTIVPGHIRTVAEQRGISPYNVYGAEWVASSGFTKDEEMEIERSYYYKDISSSDGDEESCSDDEIEDRKENASLGSVESKSDSRVSWTESEDEDSDLESEMNMDDYDEEDSTDMKEYFQFVMDNEIDLNSYYTAESFDELDSLESESSSQFSNGIISDDAS